MLYIPIILLFLKVINASVLKPGLASSVSINEIDTITGRNDLLQNFYRVIFPGTKWCGDGDIAENFDDLGYFRETDKCCRAHDYCDDIIFSGEARHGLVNKGKYTRLHCKCDLEFFSCLSKTNCNSAGIIGFGYFNILGGQCFNYKPPARCVEHTIHGIKRCLEYEYSTSEPEMWQWFDVPFWSITKN